MNRPEEPAAPIVCMKSESAGTYESLAPLYRATLRHIIEDHNLDT